MTRAPDCAIRKFSKPATIGCDDVLEIGSRPIGATCTPCANLVDHLRSNSFCSLRRATATAQLRGVFATTIFREIDGVGIGG